LRKNSNAVDPDTRQGFQNDKTTRTNRRQIAKLCVFYCDCQPSFGQHAHISPPTREISLAVAKTHGYGLQSVAFGFLFMLRVPDVGAGLLLE